MSHTPSGNEPIPQRSLSPPEQTLARLCPVMAVQMHRLAACELRRADLCDPYESLFSSVVYQQLSGKAAGTILGRVKEQIGHGQIPNPDALLAQPEENLRACGLSRQKAAALRDLAARTREGIVPPQVQLDGLSDQEIIERLTQVRGVGRWTVQMYLMFTLGRLDIWPAEDLGVRRGIEVLYGQDMAPKALLAFADRFAPVRSVAAWHAWRAWEAKTSPASA